MPIERKLAISSDDQSPETTSLSRNISGGNLHDALCSQFAAYSELADLIPPGCVKDERHYSELTNVIPPGCDKDNRREEMLSGDYSLVGDHVNDSSDANPLFDNTIHFPVDWKAGKVVAP